MSKLKTFMKSGVHLFIGFPTLSRKGCGVRVESGVGVGRIGVNSYGLSRDTCLD